MTNQRGSGDQVDLRELAAAHRRAQLDGNPMPAGRLLGLPELPDGDVWVDIAGATAITGLKAASITAYLSRRGPKANPFPVGYRHLYRLYWPLRTLDAWMADRG